MDPITRLSQLLEALRLRQKSAQSTRTQRSSTSVPTTQPAASKRNAHNGSKASLEELNRRIRERIRRLNPEELHSNKAAQIFIDSVLAWEFGDTLLQSDAYSRYSKDVRAAMTSNPAIRDQLEQLLDEFLT